jgi:hypothetical protein
MFITDLKYESYDTGFYGDSKAGGLTLHFISENTGLQYYTIFNVNLTSQRGSNKGAKLPKKRFWITKRFLFYSFWYQTCGLPGPSKGLSSFHDCMGKLKSLTFQAKTDDGKRLVKTTLESISSDKSPTTIRQLPDKAPIISPDKEVDKSEAESAFEKILTTCETNHVISKQGDKKTRLSTLAIGIPKIDANQDWSDQCDNLF